MKRPPPATPHNGTFDRTYEGLKRAGAGREGVGAATFDRTYEGLKHSHHDVDTPPPRPAFDRTYEGLKRAEDGLNAVAVSPFDRTYEGLKRYVPGPPPLRPGGHL